MVLVIFSQQIEYWCTRVHIITTATNDSHGTYETELKKIFIARMKIKKSQNYSFLLKTNVDTSIC